MKPDLDSYSGIIDKLTNARKNRLSCDVYISNIVAQKVKIKET